MQNGRFVQNEAMWARIKDHLPGKKGDPGGTAAFFAAGLRTVLVALVAAPAQNHRSIAPLAIELPTD